MTAARRIGAVLVALLAALFLWEALTVPAFAATAPLILAIALAILAFVLWPRGRRQEAPNDARTH